MSKRKEYKVIVEGQEFKSISEAARFLNAEVSCVRWALKFNKDRKYKGLSVRFADDAMEANVCKNFEAMKLERKAHRLSKKKSGRNSPIYCENLNKTFKTIKSAAKFAGTSTYTLSTKTEVSGRFVDKAGNVYTRLKPMNRKSTKQYPNTGDTLKFERSTGYVKAPIVAKENVSGVKLAQTILKGKAIDYIQNNNFDLAKELLDIVKQIKE
ncbi:MAG: hypothetical protein J6Z11_04525 [Candidatus Riflebacteria bacterium]|nr:hypothetical protein [Candidatus Riflebacteria bacterium]